MSEEIELIYNTRIQSGNLKFHTRLAEALANELERERASEYGEVFADEEISDFPGDDDNDDDMDLNCMPNDDDASDVENDLVIEPHEEFDSDDYEEVEVQNAAEDFSGTIWCKNEPNIEIEEQNAPEGSLLGKDGTIWCKNEPNIKIEEQNAGEDSGTICCKNEPNIEIEEQNAAEDSFFGKDGTLWCKNEPNSDDDEELQEESSAEDYFLGKDGTIWCKNVPNSPIRISQHNIPSVQFGPKEQNSVPIEVFKKFFTPNITLIIISETNRHGKAVVEKWNAANPSKKPKVWKDMTETELKAFVGILLAAGCSHNNMQNPKVLWQTNNLPIFRAAMSVKRFSALARYIRFDDGKTRAQRLIDDKAAPIRDIWNILNENLAKNYSPHGSITMDEQLFPYRGKTKFTQYIPSKPSKYGIKIWWACDSKSKYPLQGKLYTGRQEGEKRVVNQGENVMLELAKPYSNTGRTIVADQGFTTLEGARRLASIGLSFVGNIRSNQRCIPKEMRKNRRRPVLSSLFGFHENLVSISSYVPKRNQCVNLLSTVHYTKHCEGESIKPEALLFYNKNKAGVIDCMDQMMSNFTTKRPTRRWTFAFFCNMLDIMALAAFCICKEVDGLNKINARKNFLTTLADALVLPNVEKRMNNIHISKQFSTRLAMESFFGRPLKVKVEIPVVVPSSSGADTLRKRKSCQLCSVGEEKTRRLTRFFLCQVLESGMPATFEN